MAELGGRQTQIRAIRNVLEYTQDEQFNQRLIVQVQGRLRHLDSAWTRFLENHEIIINRAVEDNLNDEVAQHEELYNEIENDYLTARGALQARIEAVADHQDENSVHDDDQSEDEVPNGQHQQQHQNANNDNDIEDEPNNPPVPQNQQQNVPAQPNHQAADPAIQFGALVQRMCAGFAHKKENTWGYFDGDLKKWQGFHDGFKANVHDDELIAPTEKLRLLKASLKGIAAERFGEWPSSDDNYFEAWDWFKEQNARPYHTSQRILFRLLDFKKLDKASGFHIEKLCTTAQEVVRQLRAMQHPVQYFDMILVHCIHSKLDPETSKDWEIQRKSETPTFKEIIEFLQLRGRALSNAQMHERKESSGDRKRHASNGAKFESKKFKKDNSNSKKESNSSGQSGNNPCKICNDGIHYHNQCDKFKSMDLNARKAAVRDAKLCFNCLSPFHVNKDCKAKNCRNCNGNHNTLLCNQNGNKKTANSAQTKRNNNKKQKNKKDVKTE